MNIKHKVTVRDFCKTSLNGGPATAKRIYVADDSSELTGCKVYRIRDPNYSSAVVMRCTQESLPVEQQTVTIDGVEYQRIKR